MNQVIVRCPAKINLSFEILGKADRKSDPHPGYHYVDTAVQTIDIYDYLTITKRDKGRVLTGAMVAKDSLISRAVDALETAVGYELPCDIHLDKQIPIGAGLGGGSSNCAGTLLGLTNLFDLPFDDTELMAIGAELGADVPLFIHGGLCHLTGIGTDIRPLPPYAYVMFVIFLPHMRLSTREAYEEWDKTGLDFESQAMAKSPQLRSLIEEESLPIKVSGKGPSCFIMRNKDYYEETMELVQPLIEIWDGDIFISRPCGGVGILD